MTSRLGKGGMSHVFLATQHSFERQVAIKILTPTLALEPRFAERFMQEARTVASTYIYNSVKVGVLLHSYSTSRV